MKWKAVSYATALFIFSYTAIERAQHSNGVLQGWLIGASVLTAIFAVVAAMEAFD